MTDGRRADTAGGTDTRPVRTGLLRSLAHRLAGDETTLPVEGRLSSFAGATNWLNSEPLTPEGLRGRVVAVDFWTYTCVNWLRTFPYRHAWARKYGDAGLTIVGVHTPEFGFEHDIANVVKQSAAIGVEYPIAVDSDYGVWRTFDNHFWPALYLADHEGRLRFHHFGEGEYAMAEMAIQQLLLEAGATDLDQGLVDVDPKGLEVAADWSTLRSPETYTGYLQASGFASDEVAAYDQARDYEAPRSLALNNWALGGNWTVARHAAIVNAPDGRIAFQFGARDVNLVMGPAQKGDAIPFRLFLDGQPAIAAPGTDVDAEARGVVTEQKTYQLIRGAGVSGSRRFEIEFADGGVEAYCFTFG
jgi:thiol-disulfide isomerase/thioredoxin